MSFIMYDSEGDKKQEWSEPKLFSLDFKDTNQGLTTNNFEDDYNFNPLSG